MTHGTRHAPLTSLLAADAPLTPERRLWLAVVEIALFDLTTRRRERTLAWFHAAGTTPGSFAWICDVFGASQRLACIAVRAGIPLPRTHSWGAEAHRIGPVRNKPLASTRRNTIR